MSYLTIEHIKNCKEENGNDYVDKRKGEIEIHKYECHTLPASEWNLTILEEVFCLVNTLFDNDEINRANRLFINWFGDVKILDILKLINDEEDNHIFYEKRKLAKQIGKACVNTEKFDLVMETLEIKEDFLFYTIEEIEKSIIDKYHHQKLEESLDSLEVLSVDPIVDGIKKLIEQNRYEELVAIRDSLKKRSLLNEKGKMILAFLKIITRDAEWDENQSRTLWEEIESLELPDNQYENRMIYYSIYTLVSAYLQNKSRSCIAQDTTERYVNIHKNSDSRYYLLFFNAVAFLGKWIKERDKKEILESKEDIIQIIKNLYIKNWGLSEIEYEIPSIKACLLKAFIILSQKESSQFQNNLNGVLDKIFEGNPANKLIDPGMLYYMNNIPRMQAWVDEWLQRNGRIWAEPIEIRNEIIKYFLDVKEKYDKRNELSLRGAEELVKWSTLSSASTMEYCLFNMLDWYNKLVDNYPQYISSYGNAVKQISDIIEIIGSNRNEYYINCKIYSDWGTEGFKGIQQVLQNPYLLNQCISEPSYLIEMLIGNLKEKKCDKKELLTIWAIGIGLLDWRKEDDYDSIVSLQRAIEICAFNNGINNIKMSLSELGPAYIDLYSDPVKYRIPSRWCDNSSFIKLDDAEEIVDAFIENKENYQNSEVASAIESLYLEKRLSKEKIEKLFYIELTKDNYGLRNNSILEFLFKVGDDKDINDFIKRYIISAFENKRFYPMQDLPIIIGWRLESKGEEYTKSSLDTLINTYKCWITASQHIKEPDLKEVYDYSKDIDFETVNDYELLVKIILLIIASDDADAIRVALGGLAACLRVNIDYIEIIEKNWKRYHYQAKEWLIMIYEFLYRFCHDSREELYDLLAIHSQDEDFNVSLYSTLLCDNIDGKFLRSHKIVEKSFFADIPKSGNKLLIQTKNTNSWLSGQECVLKQIDVLESRLQIDLTDIERRTAEYSNIVKNEIFLIPLYRHKKGGAKVLCENVNIAFLRVLYKDWNDKRWYGNEAEIARGILSASEPITTLLSPQRWRWNNGVLFDNLHKLISLPEKERNSLIDNLFNLGVEENEIVLGGEIEDFTYNCELLAHMVSYFDFAGISKAQALQKYERNSRLFLKERSDYKEDWSPNIIIHQNGIQSFNQSLIMCGFSEFVLSTFKWKTVFKSDGLKIINERGEIIGRLECFYGLQSDIGNRNISNQPYMQRWVIASKALKEAIDNMKCSFSVEKVVGCIINNNIS